MDNGWVKLHRKLLEWEWFNDGNVLKVFLWLLLSASHEDKGWRGKMIKRGQRLTSLRRMAEALELDKDTVGSVLNKLKSTGEITVESNNKWGSLITITKYSEYQMVDEFSVPNTGTPIPTQVGTQKGTQEGILVPTQVGTKQEYKELKNNIISSSIGDEAENFDRQKVLGGYAQDYDWICAKSEEVRVPVDEVREGLRTFSLQLASEKDESDANERELVRHFTNWLRNDKRIKEQQKNKLTNGNKERSVLGRDNPELVRIRAELDKAIEARADY